MPGTIEAIERLRAGEIGRVLFSRGWYNADAQVDRPRQAGRGARGLDYALWQGPAPEREYRDNVVHYNWHWFWHWGTGELGNNGIHSLDICRWGLGVDYPRRVTAGGGKYYFDDDQETPDTQVVTYDFGDKAITWEGRNWHRRGFEGATFGIAFYGDKRLAGPRRQQLQALRPGGQADSPPQSKGFEGHDPHLRNFLACVRSGDRPNADIEEGHKSTLLCHLGNIAYRTGHTLNLDPATGQCAKTTLPLRHCGAASIGRTGSRRCKGDVARCHRDFIPACNSRPLPHLHSMNKAFVREPDDTGRAALSGLRVAGRVGPARNLASARQAGSGWRPGRDGVLLPVSAVRGRVLRHVRAARHDGSPAAGVYPKDPQAPICACFGMTADEVEADARRGRRDAGCANC